MKINSGLLATLLLISSTVSQAAVFTYEGTLDELGNDAFGTFFEVGSTMMGQIEINVPGANTTSTDLSIIQLFYFIVEPISSELPVWCFASDSLLCGDIEPIPPYDILGEGYMSLAFDSQSNLSGGMITYRFGIISIDAWIGLTFDIDNDQFIIDTVYVNPFIASGSGQFTAQPVPLPAALWLFLTALLMVRPLSSRT